MKINPDDIKSNDEYHLKLIGELIKGEINIDEYSLERGKHRTEKLSELKLIVNDKPDMFNLYLARVPVGMRINAMKAIFALTNEEISRNTEFSKTRIGDFIRENNDFESINFFSFRLIYQLSIIFDLPHRYFTDVSPEYLIFTSFDEYERKVIKKLTLQNIVEETMTGLIKKPRWNRDIFGVKIKNDFLDYENKYLNARVDIRQKFFTIEIHLENESSINYHELLKLENSIKLKNEIFIRNAFLRANKKLCILIAINESFTPSVTYLCERFLWRNMLL